MYYSYVYTRSCTSVYWTRALPIQCYPDNTSYDTFGSYIITLCLEVGRYRVSFSLKFKTAEYDQISPEGNRLRTRLYIHNIGAYKSDRVTSCHTSYGKTALWNLNSNSRFRSKSKFPSWRLYIYIYIYTSFIDQCIIQTSDVDCNC